MAKTTYRYDMKTAVLPPINREAYAAAAPFLLKLKHRRKALTFQQWKTLRGQALSGDVEGAEKEAILGSLETIEKHRPALMISLYHRSEDIFSLPSPCFFSRNLL